MATEILIKSLVAFIFFLPLSYKYLTPNEKHEKDIFTDFRRFIHCSGAGAAYIEVDDL